MKITVYKVTALGHIIDSQIFNDEKSATEYAFNAGCPVHMEYHGAPEIEDDE